MIGPYAGDFAVSTCCAELHEAWQEMICNETRPVLVEPGRSSLGFRQDGRRGLAGEARSLRAALACVAPGIQRAACKRRRLSDAAEDILSDSPFERSLHL